MDEQTEEKKGIIDKIAKFLPSVEKPTYKQSFNTRLMWTGIALVAYLLLSNITAFGVTRSENPQLTFLEIVLGSRFGSLMTLGIGPIVTAGILLQLLVGSKIINWDMSKPESRSKFQTWDKFLAIILAFIEGFAYVIAGAVPVAPGMPVFIIVIIQLAMGGVVAILLDEVVSKWGFGSGISLFIAAGVGSQIFVRIFSPLSTTCLPGQLATCLPSPGNPPAGLMWGFLTDLFTAAPFTTLIIPILPIIATIVVFLVVIYIQGIRIDIPLSMATMRGFGRNWSLKLLYTSNIPVILAAALIANMQLLGRVGAVPVGNDLVCGPFACYDSSNQVVLGSNSYNIVYYLSSPRNLIGELVTGVLTQGEIVRAITYLLFLSGAAMLFSVFWVSTSGMDSASVAEQIENTGMHIPGYRSDKKSMEQVLAKYIPPLAVLGGLAVGLLAALADFTGAIGTGTGILLTVMIIYNYYEELSNQRLDEAHPIVRKILGE
ncbi:MAG: preprotein translocase subunit SecY [Candidatus Aenigmatarchaeota archaeon]